MGGDFTSSSAPMDPAGFTAGTSAAPFPSVSAAINNGAMYGLHPALYAHFQPYMMQPSPAAPGSSRQTEDCAAIRLVHVLVSCAGAIQAGDYSVAHGNLAEAHEIMAVISTATGIGRIADHFAAALSDRLFPAHPQATLPPPPAAAPSELHRDFYLAGPYLKFAFTAANMAILDAFEGCSQVHIVDLAIMRGLQWPQLIYGLAKRKGGPPFLRITGIGPPPTLGGRDELREVGIRLAEHARKLNVPFSFRGVCAEQLDGIRPWMLQIHPGEALAVNSVLQLHRLLVDPDVDTSSVPAPIDTFLTMVTGLKPRMFTVVEPEADHNRPSLVHRFTNALFHYAAMFDSMEDVGSGGAYSQKAVSYLQAEIFDIVCNEGSARVERHEMLGRWQERLARAGLTQLPYDPQIARRARQYLARLLTPSLSPSGFCILDNAGGLALAWHNRPLYSVTAWRATGGYAAGAAGAGRNYYSGIGGGHLAITAKQGAAGEAFLEY